MRVFCTIVEPLSGLLTGRVANCFHCSTIRTQFIRHNHIWLAVPLHLFSEEIQCSLAIPALRDIGFQHFAFVINRPPKVACLTVGFHEDLVKVPPPIGVCPQLVNAFLPDLRSEHWAKSVSPIPNGFMADFDAALMQQIFHTPNRKREPDVHHDREADDLR